MGLAMLFACSPSDADPGKVEERVQPESLPMQQLLLTDLQDFNNQDGNWQIGGTVQCDPLVEHSLEMGEGEGILVNVPTEDKKSNLVSNWEHGDLELKFEVMVPKGSNSGVYLQGRYEIQILDSWGKAEVGSGDLGGIYQRWDASLPDGEKGYEGHAPKTNAARAPGLWQSCHLLFKAPRFNAMGEKIKDAQFDWVFLNGHKIHGLTVLSGPTRGAAFPDEGPLGPLFIQGDHGPVAFRNIAYKSFNQDTLVLQGLTYEFFPGEWDSLPDFATLSAEREGSIDRMDLEEASTQPDHYGVVFSGNLQVKTPGSYLFEIDADDGASLMIDSTVIVLRDGDPTRGRARGIIELEKGAHAFQMNYYQKVWGAVVRLYYEGPSIEKRPLASVIEVSQWQRNIDAQPMVMIESVEDPTLLRGFVQHGDEKLTHAISVGHPSGIHYSYNLLNGTLASSWKGQFIDVTNMWRGRGNSQLALPLNATIEFSGQLPIARLSHSEAAWPLYRPDDFRYHGYQMGENQMPSFQYEANGLMVQDEIMPVAEDGMLRRSLTFETDGSKNNLYYKLDEATSIDLMEGGMYNIGGKYYILSDVALEIRELENQDELVVSLAELDNFSYSILW